MATAKWLTFNEREFIRALQSGARGPGWNNTVLTG